MKYTHDLEGLLFEKLKVSNTQTHYSKVEGEELKRRIKKALVSGNYSDVHLILVRTAELQEMDNGEVYGRYCPLEVALEKTPWFAVEAKTEVLKWLSEKDTQVMPKRPFLRRLAARLEALADRLETQ